MNTVLKLPLAISRALGLSQYKTDTSHPHIREKDTTQEADAGNKEQSILPCAYDQIQGDTFPDNCEQLAVAPLQSVDAERSQENPTSLSTEDWETIIQTIVDDYENEITFMESRKTSGLVGWIVGTIASACIFAITIQKAISFYNPFFGLQRMPGRDSLLIWCLLLLFFILFRVYAHLKSDECLSWSDGVFSATYATIIYAVPALALISSCRFALIAIASITIARLVWISIEQHHAGTSVAAILRFPATRHALRSAVLATGVLIPLTMSGILYQAKASFANPTINPETEKQLVESGIEHGGYTNLQSWVDFAQHIVNVESRHLGFYEDETPVVKATLMDDRANAGYCPASNTILINVSRVEAIDGAYSYQFLAHQMFHELAHVQQNKLVFSNSHSTGYNRVAENLDEKRLEQWRRELLLYPIASYSEEGYCSLDVERYAEQYAQRRMEEYEATNPAKVKGS